MFNLFWVTYKKTLFGYKLTDLLEFHFLGSHLVKRQEDTLFSPAQIHFLCKEVAKKGRSFPNAGRFPAEETVEWR